MPLTAAWRSVHGFSSLFCTVFALSLNAYSVVIFFSHLPVLCVEFLVDFFPASCLIVVGAGFRGIFLS